MVLYKLAMQILDIFLMVIQSLEDFIMIQLINMLVMNFPNKNLR